MRLLIELFEDGDSSDSQMVDLAAWESFNVTVNMDGQDELVARITVMPDPLVGDVDRLRKKYLNRTEHLQ